MSTTTELRSRRVLLSAGLGALAATLAGALGRPSAVRATHGGATNDVVLGMNNNATATTKITRIPSGGIVFEGDGGIAGTGLHGVGQTGVFGAGSLTGVLGSASSGHGAGVQGSASSGDAVVGRTFFGIGVWGRSDATDKPATAGVSRGGGTGVLGYSDVTADSLPAGLAKLRTGVYGQATQDSSSRGVWGKSTAGRGVMGEATSGPGVFGISNTGNGVFGSSNSGYGVFGDSETSRGVFGQSLQGVGVQGFSAFHVGVRGSSNSTTQPAVLGWSIGQSTGLLGASGGSNPPAAKAKTGVYGQATQDSGSRGVWGRANAGWGVFGQATGGVGLYGQASTGFALRTNGRIKADKVSGVATIPSGATSVVIQPGVNVTPSSFVLLTPMANLGSRALWFTTNTTDNKVTIRMSSPRTSNTRVAWLLLG